MLTSVLQTGASALAPVLACGLPRLSAALSGLQQRRGLLWSVERENGHQYKDVSQIIDDKQITAALEKTKTAAKDPVAIKSILQAAKERSFLTNYTPGAVQHVLLDVQLSRQTRHVRSYHAACAGLFIYFQHQALLVCSVTRLRSLPRRQI